MEIFFQFLELNFLFHNFTWSRNNTAYAKFFTEVFINKKSFIIAINYWLNGELLQTFYFDEGKKKVHFHNSEKWDFFRIQSRVN